MHVNEGGDLGQHSSLSWTFFLLVLFGGGVLAQEGTVSTSSEPVILSGYRFGYRGLFGTVGILIVAGIVIPTGVLSVLYLLFHRCTSSRNKKRSSGSRSKGVFWKERATESEDDGSDIIWFRADEGRYSVNRPQDDPESTCLISLECDGINFEEISLLTFNEWDASSVATNVTEWSTERSCSDVLVTVECEADVKVSTVECEADLKVTTVECEADENSFMIRSNNSSHSDAIETPPNDIANVITQIEATITLVDNQPRPLAVVTGYNEVLVELMGKDKRNAPCFLSTLSNEVRYESFKTELKMYIPGIKKMPKMVEGALTIQRPWRGKHELVVSGQMFL